jgi:alkanesulfonate monooxygenase SsuD/methylene tetrahydromethanopterin reductase-like flavin-dependent oxidoreductase (luciferase family)
MRIGLFTEFSYPGKSESQIYREVMAEIELADQLGYDFFSTTQSYGLDPASCSPFPLGLYTAAAQRTKTIRFFTGILCVPLHHPAMLASEIAAADLLSGGRIELGLGRGHPWLYPRLGLDPEESRQKFEEGMELLLRIFDSEIVESFKGRFWNLERFQLSPRPLQRPRPPIFVAAIPGSPSSQFAIEHGLGIILAGYLGIPLPFLKAAAEGYRQSLPARGDGEIILGMLVHVAETKDEARENGIKGLTEQVRLMFQRAGEFITDNSDSKAYAFYREFPKVAGGLLNPEDARKTVEETLPRRALLWGTPDDVLDQIRFFVDEIRPTRLLLHMNAGGLDHDKVTRSMRLFAESVMPALKQGH